MRNEIVKNIGIFILGGFLGAGVFFVTKDARLLTASVLDIAQLQQIQKSGWDISFKHENQLFEVFGSEKIQNTKNLHLEVLYNPETITLSLAEPSSFEVDRQFSTGVMMIKLSGYHDVELDHNLFQIAFSGDRRDILLGEATAIFPDGKRKSLKVGNLSAKRFELHQN